MKRSLFCFEFGFWLLAAGGFKSAASDEAGYLTATNILSPSLRIAAPPKPPLLPLPPLPLTYIPGPKYSAEFMAELKANSVALRPNFMVQVSTDPQRVVAVSSQVLNGGVNLPGNVAVVSGAGPQQLVPYFYTGTAGINSTGTPALPFVLPIRVEVNSGPVSGTSRTSYEVR